MSPSKKKKKEINRRDFLKAAALGTGAMYLAKSTGCSPQPDPDIQPETAEGTKLGFYRPKPSPWFTSLDETTIQCTLCPKECLLEEGERSPCRVRENRDGVGYTLAYGNPALVQEDPIERKPFYHVLPASRALSISTVGCNLSCKFCEVWDMALVAPEEVHAYDMPPKEIISHARASGVNSISYAFGEPVVFYEYLMDIADLAKEAGYLNLIHSAGFIQPEPLRKMCTKIDAANIDLKGFDPGFYQEIVGGPLEPVLDTLKVLRDEGVHIEITNIIIPTLNEDLEIIRKMCTWIVKELGEDTPLHFSRFYPLYKLSGLPRTSITTLDQARSVAQESGLNYVYIAKVIGHDGENTFCPNCGELIIKRLGFVVDELKLDQGRCQICETSIPGIW